MNENRKEEFTLAMNLLMNVDKNGFVYDPTLAEMISSDQLFDKYFEGLTVRNIFDNYLELNKRKHEIMDQADAEEKALKHMLITQPDFNDDGEECQYIVLDDVEDVIKDWAKEDGLTQDEIDNMHIPSEECLLIIRNGVNVYAVSSLKSEMKLEDWENKE